jgi:hypothetical protein
VVVAKLGPHSAFFSILNTVLYLLVVVFVDLVVVSLFRVFWFFVIWFGLVCAGEFLSVRISPVPAFRWTAVLRCAFIIVVRFKASLG